MSLFDQIPGYQEAVSEERWSRDLAFFDFPIPLCGVMVRQLCPIHYALLDRAKNRFVSGGIIRPEDVAQLLWIVSEDFSTDATKRDAFIADIGPRVSFIGARVEINGYFDRAFMDAPPSGGVGQRSYTSWLASIVHLVASEYGWDDTAILNKPFARIFQYVRCIQKQNNPRAPQFNPSDRLVSLHLAERNQQAAQGRNN